MNSLHGTSDQPFGTNSSDAPHHIFSPGIGRVGKMFSAKAHRYDEKADIQAKILHTLAAQVKDSDISSCDTIADIGCGTGNFSYQLTQTSICPAIIGVDIAWEALRIAHSKNPRLFPVLADACALPFKLQSCAAVVMASIVQWIDNPATALIQASQLLKTGGNLWYAVFCSGSFTEICSLRRQWGLSIPVTLLTEDAWHGMLLTTGLTPIHHKKIVTKHYFSSACKALKHMSSYGATATFGKKLSRKELADLCSDYERQFSTDKGIPISYYALIGCAQMGRHNER